MWFSVPFPQLVMVAKPGVCFFAQHGLPVALDQASWGQGLCRQPRTTSKLDIQVKSVESDPILHPSSSGNRLG